MPVTNTLAMRRTRRNGNDGPPVVSFSEVCELGRRPTGMVRMNALHEAVAIDIRKKKAILEIGRRVSREEGKEMDAVMDEDPKPWPLIRADLVPDVMDVAYGTGPRPLIDEDSLVVPLRHVRETQAEDDRKCKVTEARRNSVPRSAAEEAEQKDETERFTDTSVRFTDAKELTGKYLTIVMPRPEAQRPVPAIQDGQTVSIFVSVFAC